ncbi:meiotic recombination protein REC114 [Hoplias malabaricus]|uniref:meiotic recombination protein REC114 n=1 Tax=Hoplias malabaricus TaxID=27720 RepID=UPI003462E155
MSENCVKENCVWKLKRYGRFLPKAKVTGETYSWKVFESSESTGQLELVILESGHLLISQAEELLEGFFLPSVHSFLKIHQKSDSLLFHMTLKGESRMIRLQFDGSTRPEAVEFCCKAVQKLKEYLPVGPQEPHVATPSKTPTETPQAVAKVPEESLSIKHLSQYFLGERGLSLPLAYHHFTLPSGDVEDLLRLCLFDCGFPAFVEEVESKLKGLTQE